MLSLSPSKIRDLQTCPTLFCFKHVEKVALNDEQSSALSMGIGVHAALDAFFGHHWHNRDDVDLDKLLYCHWPHDRFADREEAESCYAEALTMLGGYLSKHGTPKGRILGTEVYLSRQVHLGSSTVRLGCKADRIEVLPGDVLEVLDYKTGHKDGTVTADHLASDLPTFLYYVLARVSYPKYSSVVVSQVSLRNFEKVTVRYTADQIVAHKQALAALVHLIEAGTLEPHPTYACAWCPVHDLCPAFGPAVDLDTIA